MLNVSVDCTTAEVGASADKTKTISIDDGFECPVLVDQHNWLSVHKWQDTYSVQQTGSRISVTRTDTERGGWGMNLRFKCCVRGITIKLFLPTSSYKFIIYISLYLVYYQKELVPS